MHLVVPRLSTPVLLIDGHEHGNTWHSSPLVSCNKSHSDCLRPLRQHLYLSIGPCPQDECIARACAVVDQIRLHKHVTDPHFKRATAGRHCCERLTKLAQMARARGLGRTLRRAESRPCLGRIKREPGSVHASAPRARQHFVGLQRACFEPLTHPTCLRPSFGAQVALGAAVAQAKTGWVERARGQSVAEQRDHAAFAQPCFCACLLRGPRRQGCKRQGAGAQYSRSPPGNKTAPCDL